ncbi:toxin-antitoxin system TumE family protein [Paenibacillus crassostreae]|uniref:Uncharacterized protein n=1 Tax=Paenibacillus crassostreae TaxID=1763538 RepID=A0A167E2M4_9BACL|nr:DUF6516 family protein [Paenibacillus crassostreae]AOZ93285.1 hypothetical protein LPB68_14410 [Paenibacillus crassostreae]OAB75070.1 hypothetical protein PNBC_09525 [Paenibacillus crassostreae]
MRRKDEELYGTNFEFLKLSFPDLIDSIEDGFFGYDPSKGPFVRKTIKFVDGTFMTAFELIEMGTGKKRKYQYDWEYQCGKMWKWHNEPHNEKQHQTVSEPDHMHHRPIGMDEERRYPNYGHHDLYTIMETVFILMEVENQKDKRR